jgi:hypothetical protein
VEDYGFRRFVAVLNPCYELPPRKTVTNMVLPAAFEEAFNKTKSIVNDVNAITLTTDCWTSVNTKSFMAVTGHFINLGPVAQYLFKNLQVTKYKLQVISY